MSTPHDLEPALHDVLRAAVGDMPFDTGVTDRLLANARHASPHGGAHNGGSPRPRRGWVGPLMAAAAVVVIAGGITTVATVTHHHHPAVNHTPTPAPTSVTTSSAPTSSAPTSSAPTSSAPTSSAPTSSTAAALPTTKTIDVQIGRTQSHVVRLTVPISWHLSRTQPQACCDTPPTACLVSGRADWANDPDNCVLAVTWGYLGLSPDLLRPFPDATCHRWTTTQESDPPIQGRPGEFRAFLDGCPNAVASEMWTIVSGPQLAFWHPITAQSPHDTVAAIVSSATLPPVADPRRQFDEGYVRSVSVQSGTYHVTIDRVVVGLDGTVINHNPATYDYAITSVGGTRNYQNMSQVLTQFRKGPHPADGTPAVDGTYVQIGLDVDYNLSFVPPFNVNG